MPHVIIKYFPVPLTDEQKATLADSVTHMLTDIIGAPSQAISIALRPVEPVDWDEQVFVPDIVERRAELIKFPNYSGAEVAMIKEVL